MSAASKRSVRILPSRDVERKLVFQVRLDPLLQADIISTSRFNHVTKLKTTQFKGISNFIVSTCERKPKTGKSLIVEFPAIFSLFSCDGDTKIE